MADHNSIAAYLAEINKALKQGDSTEHTHRPALKALVEKLGAVGKRMTCQKTNGKTAATAY